MDANDKIDNESFGHIISWYFKEKQAVMTSCPDEQTLCDFLAGALPEATGREVERHIARCAACALTLVEAADLQSDHLPSDAADVPDSVLRAALSLIPAPEQARPGALLWRRLKRGAAALWQDSAELFMFRQPECIYVRGSKKVLSKNLVAVEKVFKAVKLNLEIEKISQGSSNIKVVASEPEGGALLHGVRICLHGGGRELASCMTDGGEALFEHIAFGDYLLAAWRQADKLGEVRITIQE
jgi:hypothetical protein